MARQPMIALSPDEVPRQCPGCGYVAPDAAAVVRHWFRAGLVAATRKDMLARIQAPHAPPFQAGQGQEGDGPSAHPRSPDLAEDLVEVVTWPTWFQVIALVFLGLSASALFALALIGVIFTAPYLAAMIRYGPLGPWIEAWLWGWHHGQVSLPVLGAVIATLAVRSTRRRLWALVQPVLWWTTVAAVTGFGLAALGWIIWALARR